MYIYKYAYIWLYINTIVSQKFCNISLCVSYLNVYYMTKAVQAVGGSHYGWYANTLCIASLSVWFESGTDEYAM